LSVSRAAARSAAGEKVVGIIQARMSSQRLPRKVALDVYGRSLLERVVTQARRARLVDEVVVATSSSADDEIVAGICERLAVPCHRGSLADVRSRFVAVGRERGAGIVVRVTADNPLTEPAYIDLLVAALRESPEARYATMARERIPDGSGSEAFRLEALLDTLGWDDAEASREHVTPGLKSGPHVLVVPPPPELELGGYFVGVDTFDDYRHVNRLFARYGDDPDLLRRLITDVRKERSTALASGAPGA
jgi:spore coat polysaccharide biosynthesis protein SpsF